MKKQISALFVSALLLMPILAGCGANNDTVNDGVNNNGSAVQDNNGSGAWTDENNDGIIGNDGTGYDDMTDDNVNNDGVNGSGINGANGTNPAGGTAAGNAVGDVESAVDDVGRAAENGADAVGDAVTGNDNQNANTARNNP